MNLPTPLILNSRCWRFLVRCLVCTVAIGAVTWGQRPQTPPVTGLLDTRPDHFALRDATVYVRPGQRWEHATIVFRDGVITQVGTDVEIPDDAQVLDCSGRYIYPGFIDSFSEQDLPDNSSSTGYWNARITPHRSAAEVLNGQPQQEELRKAGFVAQLIAPKQGCIKGTSVLVATVQDEDHSLVLNGSVAMHASLTIPFEWDRPSYPGSPMGAMALVRQALYDGAWYRDAWRAFRSGSTTRQPEYNTALESLVQAESSQIPWILDASNERYFMRADQVGREFGLPVIVRGSGREYRRLDDIVESGRGIIVPVNFPKAPDVASADAASFVTLERLLHWDLAPENPGRLAAAGADIAFTTLGLKATTDFWPELRKAIQRGLDPTAALAALTTTPARWFGVEDQLGTIERGKAASLVICDHDLFAKEDVPKNAIVETWVHGIRFRHAVADQDDLRGKWSIQLDDVADAPNASLLISGKPDQLRARLKIGDDSKKANQVAYRQYHLSFCAPGDDWGHDGVARFTIVVVDATSREPQAGYGTWADGSPFQVTAQRTGGADEAEQNEEDEEEAGPTDEADKPEKSDKAEIKLPPRDKALFDVTYPLGAYGVDGERPARPAIIVFKHATIWTSGPAGKLTDADVVIANGLIEAVGKDLAVPEGAHVVDCQGKHLTPGIVDCHSHIATDGGINEGTQAITAEVRIGDFIDADDISIYRQLAGGVTSANILHGSANPIGGQNQVIKLRWGESPEALKFREAPAGIKFALGENVKQSNWGDRFNSRYPQSRMGVGEIIDDAFRRAAQYDREHEDWERDRKGLPPRLDLELAALAEVLAGTRWIHCHSYQQSELLTLMKICDRHNVRIGTFQHVLEGYKVADEMARRGIMASAFSDWWAYKFEVYDAIPYAGALMHDAGVVVSFNSDDPEMGRRLNLEAAKAIHYGGVAPEEALKFVTLNPARQLRIEQWVGSVEPGKHADLVVWSSDPLSTTSRCEQTWIDGTCYFDLDENTKLEQRDAKRHADLVQLILAEKVPTIKPEDEEPEPDSLWPRADEYCQGHPHD